MSARLDSTTENAALAMTGWSEQYFLREVWAIVRKPTLSGQTESVIAEIERRLGIGTPRLLTESESPPDFAATLAEALEVFVRRVFPATPVVNEPWVRAE